MKVTVINFKCVKRAEIELSERVTLICAANHAGKTSILEAMISAFTGATIPIKGVSESMAGQLVKTGEISASVELHSSAGMRKVNWPQCKVQTKDVEPPTASEFATGFLDLSNLKQEDKAKEVTRLTGTEPTAEDLVDELTKADIDAARIKTEVDNVFGVGFEKGAILRAPKGWDASLASAEEMGRHHKRKFQEITGRQYGSKVGAEWYPRGWEHDLSSASKDSISEEIAHAKQVLEGAIASEAVGAHRREELQELAANKERMMTELAEKRAEIQTMDIDLKELQATRPSVPGPMGFQTVLKCAHCDGENVVKGDKLVKPEEGLMTQAERKEAGDKLMDWNKQVAAKQTARDEVFHQISTLNNQATRAVEAERLLTEITEGVQPQYVEACREEVRKAETRLQAFISKTQANAEHESIMTNQRVIDVLAADGLRQKKLAQGLEIFNDRLAELCAYAGWMPVSLSPDLKLEMGGDPYWRISESERYRCRVVLRIAIAEIEQAPVILLDAADILDETNGGRNALMQILVHVGIPTVVAMTCIKKKIPNLSGAGLGKVYWLESGVTSEFSHVVTA